MTADDYRLLFGKVVDPPDFPEAVEAWLEYYRDTEAFDVSLGCPPSRSGDGVGPVTRDQRSRSAGYAARAAARVRKTLWSSSLSAVLMQEAQRAACDLHVKELRTGVKEM